MLWLFSTRQDDKLMTTTMTFMTGRHLRAVEWEGATKYFLACNEWPILMLTSLVLCIATSV
jgi:hypothetical protein